VEENDKKKGCPGKKIEVMIEEVIEGSDEEM
jgi:hypothetical protein